MSDIMKFIKNRLKGSSAMPPASGVSTHTHDHGQHHHVHGAGCCGHGHDYHHDHKEPEPMDEEDCTTPGKGDCC